MPSKCFIRLLKCNQFQVIFQSHTKKQTSQCFGGNQMQTSTLNKDSENFNE